MSSSTLVYSADAGDVLHRRSLHPLHAYLLAGASTLFASSLLSDWAYFSSFEIQWKNFAAWLILGGLVFGGFALLWALVDLFRAGSKGQRVLYFVVLLAAWILGFINELVHAKDAWASMPTGLVISGIVAALALIATIIGFSTMRTTRR